MVNIRHLEAGGYYITKKGEALLKQILPIVSQNNKYLEDLLDDNELELILKLLNKIKQNI